MRRIVFSIYILFLVFACKKEEPKKPVSSSGMSHGGPCPGGYYYHHHSSDVTKQKFRPNSWWVYEDSVSIQSDSCYVSSVIGEGSAQIGLCHIHETYSYSLQHTTNRTDRIYLVDEQIHSLSGSIDFLYISPFYYNFDRVSYTAALYTGVLLQQPDTILKVDSMFVYDRYYKKVVISKVRHAPTEDSLKTVYYTNSDFGLLRKDVFNTNGTLKHKWLLKNKNVIR
ncbi:MAG: hypothetical protein K0S33_4278 [Bacteroidetes bacterium]|jgi:hypothetical protein|nr:hypothetical protein [Bacteroidota bacterium]